MDEECESIDEVAEKIKSNLININSKQTIELLYAFSSTGKTRISRILSEENEDEMICFNTFISELFVWDNENFIMNVSRESWIVRFINEQGLENQIAENFRNFVTSKLEPRFELNRGQIMFDILTGDDNKELQIKISTGEEKLFIWSVFYTILMSGIDELNTRKEDRSTDIFNNLKYVIIDDPISSVDDSKVIIMALNLIKAIDSCPKLNFLITTHFALLYNLIFNNYKKTKQYPNVKLIPYVLLKNQNVYRLKKYDKDTPFGYHLVVISEIEDAIKNDAIERNHYNLLRGLFEKTSTFLGYKNWTECIIENQKAEFIKKINLYSHSRLIDLEYKELPEEDKELFIKVFNNFKKEFKWGKI